jgi:hypothetical protein
MAGKEPKPAKVTLDYLERYGNGIDGVASEAASEFEREARSVIASHGDPSQWADADRDAIRDDVAGLMERYVGTYGDAVQAIASNAFAGVLEAQGAPDGVPIADVDMSQRAAASSRYWAGSLWGDAPDADAYVAGCSSFVDRHVRHSADYCLLEAANGSRHRKKLRYARVPQGPTCGFCTMLASRGFVYASKESAGELGQFHDGCNCLIVAGFDGLEVEGYDYRGMYERYESCRDSIGPAEDIWRDFQELPPAEKDAYGRKPRAMLAEIPQSLLNKIGGNANAFNDYYAHRICREMDTRDRQWLFDGTISKPTFATEAIEESVSVTNPWELRSAMRLATVGIKPDFIQDYEWYVGADGIKRKRGLPDLANGVEIKTPRTSMNPYGAVDNYLDNCISKKGVTRIVIDNYESNFTDSELHKAIEKVMQDYPFDMVSYYGKDGALRNVYKKR